MSKIKLSLSILFIFQLFACADPETFQDIGTKDRLARMAPEERKALAPNELFMAVLDSNLSRVKELSESSPQLLLTKNDKDANTPLGMAIDLRETEIADYLLQKSTLEMLLIGNKRGESYIFLAAKAGNVGMIRSIGDNYYQSKGFLQGYDFGDLDFLNEKGQRALHVAKDRQVIEALQVEYYRGMIDFPFWKFTMLEDKGHQTFLHTAALSLRADVLRWGVEKLCGFNSWEKEGGMILGSAGYLWTRARRGVQTYVGGFGIGANQRFNVQDVNGDTPIHLAAGKRSFEVIQVISGCEWIDFDLMNNEGNLAIQSFLKSLDTNRMKFSDEDYRIFNFLLQKRTRMRTWFKNQESYVDSQNKEGQSSLHIAANLADPYFYDRLSEIGNIELQDSHGHRPFEIRKAKQQMVDSNGL